MTKHRLITSTALIALAAAGSTAPVAGAGSLLSGYGGPGQGNQAILGAALIGGGSSSSGGGASSGGSQGSGVAPATAPAVSAPATGGSTSTRGGAGARPRRHATGAARPGSRVVGVAPVKPAGARLAAGEAASVSTPVLGISAADFIDILLAFAALLLTAVITGRLVRRTRSSESRLKA